MLKPPLNSLKNMVKAEDIKMLTPSDIKKIKNFENLTISHQRTFRHRLCKKFINFQKDLEIVLLNYENLGIKIGKVIDIVQMTKLLELYENLTKLQNM